MEQKNIRNFAIIAHVDHGKSTLSDRLLELTGTVQKNQMREQFLDQNPISRERGITIKLAPVRMEYEIPNNKFQITNKSQIQDSNSQKMQNDQQQMENSNSRFILNLIDTPGHVDFSYEVSRTLAACEGVVLLVDATQNIQAQTVAHYNSAKKEGLAIIPVINKIDMLNANVDLVVKTLDEAFGFKEEKIIKISAKTGENVEFLLGEIIKIIPSPKGNQNAPTRALIFDAFYDEHRGVIAYVRVVDGEIRKGEEIELYQNKLITEVKEVGYFTPFLKPAEKLSTGEIGYIVTGIKNIRDCRVGDTVITVQNSKFSPRGEAGKIQNEKVESLPGYKLPKAMVFFGMYPRNPEDFVALRKALDKICLNDTSLSYQEEYSAFLGSGFRVGFLGLLHAEIIRERIQKEEGVDLLLTMPQVLYQKTNGEIFEPFINLLVYTPAEYVGNVITVCQKRKGRLLDMVYHDAFAVLSYSMPYSMFIRGLSSEIKNMSSGFASIDYEFCGYEKADLANLEILVNDILIDILSELVYKDEMTHRAIEKTEKLKNLLPKRQFKQVIQAVANGKIISRAEISPFRKDVLKKMSGGDRTRKDKLLEAQKKGKKRLFSHSKIEIPQEVIYSMIRS
ncbi:MAG: translation elongation factor 4 [bacterium]|nr:translation elongation factor 4 [bacterium]